MKFPSSLFRTGAAAAALALSLTCCACGAASPASSALSSAAPAAASGSAGSSAAVSVSPLNEQEGAYSLDRTITVDHGRTLTLRLHGAARDNGSYGISVIDVLDGGKTVQTISVHEAIMAEWKTDDSDGFAESPAQDGALTTDDMNFDGAGDIGLQGWITAGANVPVYYWLWNAEKQQFDYAFCLSNAKADAEKQELVCSTRSSAAEYDTDYYRYGDDGKLIHVRQVQELWAADGTHTTTVYENQNGTMQAVN